MTARKAPAPEPTEPLPAAAPPHALPSGGGSYVLVDGIPTPETQSPADDAALTDPEA
jgi:hypothetical protein